MTLHQPDLPDAPACPLLGLAGDARTRFTFPHPDHRCHAKGRPHDVAIGHQARYCLAGEFVSCERYRGWVGLRPSSTSPAPAPATVDGPRPRIPHASQPAGAPIAEPPQAVSFDVLEGPGR